VIIALHHEQDIRKMGGLRKYMPVTYWTALVGALALIGFPGFSGFFSKDALIEAVRDSHWTGEVYWIAYLSVVLGVFVTGLYTFRWFFKVFHGEERLDKEIKSHVKESPLVVTVPLIMLAIPAAIIGWFTIGPVLFGGFFGDSIIVTQDHDVLAHLGESFRSSGGFLLPGSGRVSRSRRGRDRMVPVPRTSGTAATLAREHVGSLQASRQQVLHRRPLHQGIRSGRPAPRSVPVDQGRRTRHRRCAGQRHGQHGSVAAVVLK
jgi:hypothetical protein